jgi:hypothetical protein
MMGYSRAVKRFLSLFWVMYILPAGKSISPLKGLKPASLKILSPLLEMWIPPFAGITKGFQ